MISIDQAKELVENAIIPFPTDWRAQMERAAEDAIRNQASRGKRMANVQGTINANYNRYYLNAEQFSEVSAIVRKWGFRVEDDFRIRYDGQPLTIDIFW